MIVKKLIYIQNIVKNKLMEFILIKMVNVIIHVLVIQMLVYVQLD